MGFYKVVGSNILHDGELLQEGKVYEFDYKVAKTMVGKLVPVNTKQAADNSIENENQDLQNKLEKSTKEFEEVSNQLSRSEDTIESLHSAISDIKKENENLVKQLKTMKADNDDLRKQITESKKKKSNINK